MKKQNYWAIGGSHALLYGVTRAIKEKYNYYAHVDDDDMWKDSGDTVQNTAQISASGTSLTVVAGTNFEIYQLIRIGSEYLFMGSLGIASQRMTRNVFAPLMLEIRII